jgi:aminotransferase
MQRDYQVCGRCVMDTTDPEIWFDAEGVCNHCKEFEEITSKRWYRDQRGEERLREIIGSIKVEGKARTYDCIIGLSGGVDSSYLALRARDWGLRPLVVHVDAGWNSELAVANIEKIIKHCNYHLYTHVVDWDEMRDLQLAYLRAGVPNQDVPQDHVFFATLYRFALKHDIRYVFSGGNIATEAIVPKAWQGAAMDSINLRAIHRRYGERRLKTYSTVSFFQYYFWYPVVRGLRILRPLNYLPYDKAKAQAELATIGWRSYGRKHGESLFTKFFQNFYLPKRFGYDKRKPHLSSLIVSGQITRDEALRELAAPLYPPEELEADITYFCKKLRIDRRQFDGLMAAPIRQHNEFPNWNQLHGLVKRLQRTVERVTGRRPSVYGS